MRNIEKGQAIHVMSRAVEEKRIFNEETDCLRFVFQIYAANIGRPVASIWRQDVDKVALDILNGEKVSSNFIIKEHDPLVNILDFALVINHNHFYLIPNNDDGVSFFIKKLNIGFAKYFNLKYGRKGALFGSRYQLVPIKNQFQSDAVSRYISVINPLDVFQPKWREEGLNNWRKAIIFLTNYQFSSFPDKIGKRKSKILAPPEILEKYLTIGYGDTDAFKEFAENFLRERSGFSPLFLE